MENTLKVVSENEDSITVQLDIPKKSYEKIKQYSDTVGIQVDGVLQNKIADFAFDINQGNVSKTSHKPKRRKREKEEEFIEKTRIYFDPNKKTDWVPAKSRKDLRGKKLVAQNG